MDNWSDYQNFKTHNEARQAFGISDEIIVGDYLEQEEALRFYLEELFFGLEGGVVLMLQPDTENFEFVGDDRYFMNLEDYLDGESLIVFELQVTGNARVYLSPEPLDADSVPVNLMVSIVPSDEPGICEISIDDWQLA